jgi:hypothetical protein
MLEERGRRDRSGVAAEQAESSATVERMEKRMTIENEWIVLFVSTSISAEFLRAYLFDSEKQRLDLIVKNGGTHCPRG